MTPKVAKRRFTAGEKLRILAAADQCSKQGELGALLRREGIYSSQLYTWRHQRKQGEIGALSEKKRGRKPAAANPLAGNLAESEKQVQALKKNLNKQKLSSGSKKNSWR